MREKKLHSCDAGRHNYYEPLTHGFFEAKGDFPQDGTVHSKDLQYSGEIKAFTCMINGVKYSLMKHGVQD